MSGSGGSGTLTPPNDGEHVARVIPLRRRQTPQPVPAPAVPRRRLPQERSVWDSETHDDPPLIRRRRITLPRSRPGGVTLLGVGLAMIALAAANWSSGGAAHARTGATSGALRSPALALAAGEISAVLHRVTGAQIIDSIRTTAAPSRPAAKRRGSAGPARRGKRAHQRRDHHFTGRHVSASEHPAAGQADTQPVAGTTDTGPAPADGATTSTGSSGAGGGSSPPPLAGNRTPARTPASLLLGGLGSCVKGC